MQGRRKNSSFRERSELSQNLEEEEGARSALSAPSGTYPYYPVPLFPTGPTIHGPTTTATATTRHRQIYYYHYHYYCYYHNPPYYYY
jgi:hypothetical protein